MGIFIKSIRFLPPRRREKCAFVVWLVLFTFPCFCVLEWSNQTKIFNNLAPYNRKGFNHDHEMLYLDVNSKNNVGHRKGQGEMGKAVIMETSLHKQLANESMKKWFMNLVASDVISLDRTVPDNRLPECKKIEYNLTDLPNASVVIIFTNEAWSPLLRTVHSVYNRSPAKLLHEIVLLDDASDREELGPKLDKYLKRFGQKVKLVRKKERQGLIRARLEGAKAATGDVVVFLDSHCEAGLGWLEPLVARIKEKRSAVLCPMINTIDDYSMAYSSGHSFIQVGGFTWSLFFTWISLQRSEAQKKPHEPVKSPTMAGGLFAVDREYFFEIGGYDPGMEIWGGENLEISFRTWMCGGSLEFIPCSHVGHIFRSGHPYNMTTKDVHGYNSARLAEVWLDDYKRLYYKFRLELKRTDIGDISERVALRKRLKCKSFKWYLDNIYPEKFIPDENVKAHGMVKNDFASICLDTLQRDEKQAFNLGVFSCQNGASHSQVFSWSNSEELRREESCADAKGTETEPVRMMHCHGHQGNQRWIYTKDKQLLHFSSNKCLDSAGLANGQDIVVKACDLSIPSQIWSFIN